MTAEKESVAFPIQESVIQTYPFPSYLGVTPPISTMESNEREKEVTMTLMEELRRQNTFESEEEARTR